MTARGRRGFFAAALVAVLALLLFSPLPPLQWRCPIAAATHVPCPTCGMTRAFSLALHGDFAAATAMHPLVWLVAPATAAWLAIELVGYLRTGAWGASARIRGFTPTLVAVAALLFVVWVARFLGALGGPAPV